MLSSPIFSFFKFGRSLVFPESKCFAIFKENRVEAGASSRLSRAGQGVQRQGPKGGMAPGQGGGELSAGEQWAGFVVSKEGLDVRWESQLSRAGGFLPSRQGLK